LVSIHNNTPCNASAVAVVVAVAVVIAVAVVVAVSSCIFAYY